MNLKRIAILVGCFAVGWNLPAFVSGFIYGYKHPDEVSKNTFAENMELYKNKLS